MGSSPRPANLDSVAKFAANLDTETLACRSSGHVWAPLSSTVQNVGNRKHWTTDCETCGTVRTITYTRDGYIVRRHYRYPDGYRQEGMGHIDTHGRALMRLEMFDRMVSG
jgi:hypothetical protein